MNGQTEIIEIKGKKYTLTKYERKRANQMYDSIPRDRKAVDDWEWAVEMALQETRMKKKEKRVHDTQSNHVNKTADS